MIRREYFYLTFSNIILFWAFVSGKIDFRHLLLIYWLEALLFGVFLIVYTIKTKRISKQAKRTIRFKTLWVLALKLILAFIVIHLLLGSIFLIGFLPGSEADLLWVLGALFFMSVGYRHLFRKIVREGNLNEVIRSSSAYTVRIVIIFVGLIFGWFLSQFTTNLVLAAFFVTLAAAYFDVLILKSDKLAGQSLLEL